MIIKVRFKGGPGSGHFGHIGRPGLRGGSLPGKRGAYGGRNAPRFKVVRGGRETRPTQQEAADMAIILRRHPTKVISQLKGIVVCSTEEDWKEQYQNIVGRIVGGGDYKNCEGFYATYTKTLYLPPGYSRLAIDHEIGHAAYWAARGFGGTHVWDDSYNNSIYFDRHTAYSGINVREAFAESYAAWVQTGGKVANVSELPQDVFTHNIHYIAETFKAMQKTIDTIQ